MKRSEFRFAHALRVRWAEVDMQKVVFNGHYLMLCKKKRLCCQKMEKVN
jgi:acyl-CoA thioesterase FadM